MNRLRHGEWVAAASAVALLIALFVTWFALDGPAGPGGGATRYAPMGGSGDPGGSGWSSLGWLALALCVLAIVTALTLAVLTATRDSPAAPVLLTVLTTVAGLLALIALLIQGWAQPGTDELVSTRAGYWLGLLASAGITAGGILAMRDERSPHVEPYPVPVRPAP